jgi:hypothetical protein
LADAFYLMNTLDRFIRAALIAARDEGGKVPAEDELRTLAVRALTPSTPLWPHNFDERAIKGAFDLVWPSIPDELKAPRGRPKKVAPSRPRTGTLPLSNNDKPTK